MDVVESVPNLRFTLSNMSLYNSRVLRYTVHTVKVTAKGLEDLCRKEHLLLVAIMRGALGNRCHTSICNRIATGTDGQTELDAIGYPRGCAPWRPTANR